MYRVDEGQKPLKYRGRFAPSPTGKMHMGVARTSLAAWLDARKHGGSIILRIEDIDLQRNVNGAAEAMARDLEWLGLDWDEGPIYQSARFDRYEAALASLERAGRVFRCTCTRREIFGVSSAPHGPNDEGPRYPGTCREGPPAERPDRAAAVRFKTFPGDLVAHTDRRYGPIDQEVHAQAGDFVLKRADGMWAYQLAVSVDDLENGITAIVRGADLLSSTPRQLLLRHILDPQAARLSTLHVPLILGPGGQRLAKRDGAVALSDRRDEGKTPEHVLGLLAHSLGQKIDPSPISARELIELWDPAKIPTEDRKLSEL